MPRPARLNLPDIPQHITRRGNNHQACFTSNTDYPLCLGLLHVDQTNKLANIRLIM
jgi:hypothetical protein